jgi:hypothetical protein
LRLQQTGRTYKKARGAIGGKHQTIVDIYQYRDTEFLFSAL